ncbi:2-isopropylmalate synthase/homocitrate synthase [Propionibacterium sp. oral taxon 192 str. F0372]|uniref:citramalate synthase n=1 Tax=Propionibacterium sp. oral taxon 192 TaxID=671222 RepID=UPI0003532FB8|nr:citramalate synthase [Propionibacterium sp. oral taxon 192]EPH02939.1 2-isopropylmalate synthase/homocitrate synthase [Propionibacterium sp. oral taxon 192 str. F0372]
MSPMPVMPEVFHLYDTTLRDGAQQEGITLTVEDKLRIAGYLDRLGVNFIEGGWPGANPSDTEFFTRARTELNLCNAELVAFGATRKAGIGAAEDPQVQALLDAGTRHICLVAKSHDAHVLEALRTTLEENLAMVSDTVAYLVSRRRRVFVDCEHFFDGFDSDPGYALEVVRVAAEAGAEVVVLCDTNGGMLPSRMADIVSAAAQIGADLGVHCHNDTGCAVANTLAAIDAGVMHVQGTVNGYGERTGNMDLTTLIANLQMKYDWPVVTARQLAGLTHGSHAIAEIANQPHLPRQPYVGASSFAHKAGLHASAIQVNADLYQHIAPELVGNDMRMLISNMSGRASVQMKAAQFGLNLDDQELASEITRTIKDREAQGYSYEAADASFELLVRSMTGALTLPFKLINWRVHTSNGPTVGETDNSEATLKLMAGGERYGVIGEGNGPVNALGDALVRALTPVYPQVADYQLTDYRVRILDEGRGTDAIVRVLIDTSDGEHGWTTVGVGTNVIEASWEALSDAYLYGLVRVPAVVG